MDRKIKKLVYCTHCTFISLLVLLSCIILFGERLTIKVVTSVGFFIFSSLYCFTCYHSKKLINSLEIQDDLLSITSHEVKTPLTAVIMQIGLLERSESISNKEKETLGNLILQVKRAVHLLDQSIEINLQTPLKRGKFDLVPIVKEISELYPRVKFTSWCESIYADVDECKFRQILHNLLSNAQKYGDSKEVQVLVSEVFTQGCFFVRIEVQDTGIGINRYQIPKLFVKRYRTLNTTHIAGHGIGFYVIRNLVKAHNGFIGLQSQPNLGTSVIILFPVHVDCEHTSVKVV